MLAAAQAAKPAGAAPLPKMIDTDQQVQDTISQEEAAREQEKLEQQRKKELEAKDNEIRGLRHELELEQVARERATNEYELDKKIRQEEDKLKGERDKLEKDRAQLVQEKARQNNILQAEQMRHQAELDKATFKQQAEIAKSQAKATADIARQQAQQYIRTTDQARKQSDKYYADASAKLKKQAPAISPALQSQLDGAINSLNTFKKVHQKQLAIPSPGTPPQIKMAHIKWASPTLPGTQTPPNTTPQPQASPSPTPSSTATQTKASPTPTNVPSGDMLEAMREREANIRQSRELAQNGMYFGQGAYDASRAQAQYMNRLYEQRKAGVLSEQEYKQKLNAAEANYGANQGYSYRTGNKVDLAKDKSYRNEYRVVHGLNPWAKGEAESAFLRDAERTKRQEEQEARENNMGFGEMALSMITDPFVGFRNGVERWGANKRNAEYFGADRSWFGDTTFADGTDPKMQAAYRESLQNHGYGDNPWADAGVVAGNAAMALLTPRLAGLGRVAATAPLKGAWWATKKMAPNFAGRAANFAGRAATSATRAVPGQVTSAATNTARYLNRPIGKKIPQPSGWAGNLGALGMWGAADYALSEAEDMQKGASYIPTPGAPPIMLKRADAFSGNFINKGYNWANNTGYYYHNPMTTTTGGKFVGYLNTIGSLLGLPNMVANPENEYMYARNPYSTSGLEMATNVYQGLNDDPRFAGYDGEISPVHGRMKKMVYASRTGDAATANNWNGNVPSAKMNGR